ncbi:unnamed protein product [Periconia digitata]|uniref:Uncharacterized protein n=1 Tax=Periconia digitata TaxID=1303443 RepID=A0A9W4U8K5_9PLEO|nr:unnamed protein product [Periconia digitata]
MSMKSRSFLISNTLRRISLFSFVNPLSEFFSNILSCGLFSCPEDAAGPSVPFCEDEIGEGVTAKGDLRVLRVPADEGL